MKIKKFILLIIIINVLGACNTKDCQQEISELNSKIEQYKEQEELINTAIADYDKRIVEYKKVEDRLRFYQDSVISLTKKIKRKKYASKKDNQAVNQLMKHIKRLMKKNKAVAERLKKQVNSSIYKNNKTVVDILINNIEDKEKQIAQLENRINNLENEVSGLKIENKTLVYNKTELENKNENLDNENKKLSEITQKLKATNIAISFFNKSDSQIYKPRKFIFRIKKVGICFSVKENSNANAGNYDVYISIVHNKKVLHNSETFFTSSKGVQIGYTIKTAIDYKNKRLNNICANWSREDIKLNTGKYKIEIRTKDGEIIGESNFDL